MKNVKLFKIHSDQEKLLKERCSEMSLPLKEDEKQLLFDMVDYLKASQDEDFLEKHDVRSGVGLAAPQIGINKRFFAVYYVNEDGKEVKYG